MWIKVEEGRARKKKEEQGGARNNEEYKVGQC